MRDADVYVFKDALVDPVIAGEQAFYQITFGNAGPSTATGVTVEDILPEGFTFNRCEPIDPNDEVTCSVAGRVVTLESIEVTNTIVFEDGGDIDPGDSFAFIVVADIDAGYVLDGLTDADPGEIGYRVRASASDWPLLGARPGDDHADQDPLVLPFGGGTMFDAPLARAG